jgi:hypothetical protein
MDRIISTKTTASINKKKLFKLNKENCQLYHWWSDLWMGVNLNCRSSTLACRTPPPQIKDMYEIVHTNRKEIYFLKVVGNEK